jgi:hypothetical protein
MLRPSLSLACCIPLYLLTGCPAEPDPGTETETAAPTTSATETETAAPTTSETGADSGTETGPDDGIPGCECIVDENDASPPSAPSAPTCGESPCDAVSATETDDGTLEVSTPEALTCALTALRDRTPGVLTWASSDSIGQFEDDGYILVEADGTAVRRSYGWQDLSYIAGDAVLGTLEAPEHYAACLADTSPEGRFDCLTASLAATAVCDAGFTYDDF